MEISSHGTLRFNILSKTYSIVLSLKGGTPQRNSKRITPTLHQSIATELRTLFPLITSGAI